MDSVLPLIAAVVFVPLVIMKALAVLFLLGAYLVGEEERAVNWLMDFTRLRR